MKKLLGDLEQQERDRAREHVQFDRQPVGQVTSSPFNIIARRVTDWNWMPAPPCALKNRILK